jgi:hypothetical protein
MIRQQLGEYFHRIKKVSLEFINNVLHRFETRPVKQVKGFKYSPIFIIGPPRSGSTLLFQVMVNTFNFSYTTNADAKWYGGLSFRKRFFPVPSKETKTDFNSNHGLTRGRYAPHECGEYWYQFFRRKPQYVSTDEVKGGKLKHLTRSLQRLTTAGKSPMLFKNMNCALRLGPVHQACPDALYIVTHRDLLWNGHSLLKVRKKVHGNYNSWWSMEPEEIEDLKILPPEEQVTEQIRAINKEIDEQKRHIGANRFIDIHYEDLCEDPKKVMSNMNDFFKQHGIQMFSSLDNIPDSFPLSEQCRIDATVFDRFSNYVGSQV